MIATAAACPFMMICVKEPAWSSRTILTGSPQHFSHDLYQLGRHWNLLQAFSRGTGRDHAKARDCMSRGSHQKKKKNTKIVRRPWTRFSSQHAWENLITSLARANFTKFRYKSLPRASHNGIHTSTSMTWHLQAIPTGTSERKFLQDSHKKAPRTGPRKTPWRGILQDLHKSPRIRNLQWKCPRPRPAKTLRTRGAIFFFARACAVEMHMDMLCENLGKKSRDPDGAPWSSHI